MKALSVKAFVERFLIKEGYSPTKQRFYMDAHSVQTEMKVSFSLRSRGPRRL